MPFALTLISALLLLTGVIYFGWRKPDYSHWKHTISELGEMSSPVARPVNYGLFLPVGVLLWLAAMLTDERSMVGLATCIGAGYVVAAFFPCDVGSPMSGSNRQQIHNLGGAIEYVGGAYFVVQLSTTSTLAGYNLFALAAGSVLTVAILLSVPGLSFRGVAQRIGEVILFGSLILTMY